jgi:Skp family chaperone for outer membrane proteins
VALEVFIREARRRRKEMMKKAAIIMAFAATVLVSAWAVIAQNQTTAATAGPAKIAFINPMAVIYGTEEGNREITQLQQLTNAKQQELVTAGDELQRLQQQYMQTTNPQQRMEMERDLQERELRYKRLQEDVQFELDQRQNDLLARMSDRLQRVVTSYCEQHNIDAVFRLDQAENYVFINPNLDVTQEIISLYNQQHPSGGAAR